MSCLNKIFGVVLSSIISTNLRRANSKGFESFRVCHRKHHSFNQLLNLLVASTNVGIVLSRLFIEFHSLHKKDMTMRTLIAPRTMNDKYSRWNNVSEQPYLHTGIIFNGQFLKNQVTILVCTNKVARGQISFVYKAWNGQQNGLSGRGLNNTSLSLVLVHHVCTLFFIVFFIQVEQLQSEKQISFERKDRRKNEVEDGKR